MNDEEYLFAEDCKEKKNVANSARHRRSHNGRGGRVRFPSDSLTKKEKEAMNGEVKSYKLNAPMTYEEFKAMPKDIQEQYVKLLRKVYCAPWTEIEAMMGCSRCVLSRYMEKNGIHGGERLKRNSFQKEKWLAFVNGVPHSAPIEETPVDVVEEIPVEETPVEIVEEIPDLEECVEKVVSETATPTTDWFMEFEKLQQENCALKEKFEHIKWENRRLETDLEKARAQLDIVHLIFGGK